MRGFLIMLVAVLVAIGIGIAAEAAAGSYGTPGRATAIATLTGISSNATTPAGAEVAAVTRRR